jgi:hypothetical protein
MDSENQGLRSYNLRGELPVGGDGCCASAAASRAEYSLSGYAFEAIKASGQADSLRLGVAYPLIRSRAANIRVQVEADDTKLEDKINGGRTDKQSRGLTTTFSGDEWTISAAARPAPTSPAQRPAQLGPGAVAPDTAGRFSKTTLTAQRQQTTGSSVRLQLSWQLAGNSLDSPRSSAWRPDLAAGYASSETSRDAASAKLRWQAARPSLTGYPTMRACATPRLSDKRSRQRRRHRLAGRQGHQHQRDRRLGRQGTANVAPPAPRTATRRASGPPAYGW